MNRYKHNLKKKISKIVILMTSVLCVVIVIVVFRDVLIQILE